MAFTPDTRGYGAAAAAGTQGAVLDAGLRAYMLRVYNWMTSGLLLTGIVAYTIANTPLIDSFYHTVRNQYGGLSIQPTMLGYLSIFAPLGFVLALSFGVNRMSKQTVQMLFWLFAAVMGASLTNIFLMYSDGSIARVFFITSATFGAMSLYGYTTKADLSRWGSFLMMGLFGIILASLVNVFVGSSGLQFIISIVGVLVFTGLTAYDTQRIKSDFIQFSYAEGSDMAAKRSVFDALGLYLNFINLFLLILRLTGTGRSNN